MKHSSHITKALSICFFFILLVNCNIAYATSDSAIAENITYQINGKAYSTLDNVKQSDTISVLFTTDTGTAPGRFSLVTYKAPDSVYDEQTANQQVLFDTMSSVFYPGPHKLTVILSNCFYQLDFVAGNVIVQLGPAGSNNFYSEQNRLIAFANGGKTSCLNDNPLPIELISFTAARSGSAVALNWSTASEINNSYFELERGVNGGDFDGIGQVPGHGNSVSIENYTYTDNSSPAGILVYRLKQVDFNGNSTYSYAIEVTPAGATALAVKAWCSESGGNVNIAINGGVGEELNLSITDMQGKLVGRTNTISNGGISIVSMNMNGYGHGMYNVTIWGNTSIQTIRFIKD